MGPEDRPPHGRGLRRAAQWQSQSVRELGLLLHIMKFQLPQGSFGGAYWHDCVYAMDDPNYNLILPQRDAQGHYCPLGGGSTPAVGSFPSMRFIENYDFREPSNDPNQTGSLG